MVLPNFNMFCIQCSSHLFKSELCLLLHSKTTAVLFEFILRSPPMQRSGFNRRSRQTEVHVVKTCCDRSISERLTTCMSVTGLRRRRQKCMSTFTIRLNKQNKHGKMLFTHQSLNISANLIMCMYKETIQLFSNSIFYVNFTLAFDLYVHFTRLQQPILIKQR